MRKIEISLSLASRNRAAMPRTMQLSQKKKGEGKKEERASLSDESIGGIARDMR